MISNSYANAADWVAGFALRREPMPPDAAGCLAQVLMDLAERADRLERMPFTLAPPEHTDADA